MTANNVSKIYGSTYTFDTTAPSTDFSVAGLKKQRRCRHCGTEQRGCSSDGDVRLARSDLCDHGQRRDWNRLG